ncbi:cytochrome C [Bradyrhizobium sp. HKCCYLS20291]|uniref:cytochrome C n=1 Tax=Bradyrhizobium sp. HKCCYLS20291 TaxID=3420766 RepID=UPI003EC0D2AD
MRLAAAAALVLMAINGASAENLDAGKPAPRLFADSCASCHRSPRGLAKGRFRLTLYLFLQQHYTSSSDSASALSTYLQSVDTPAGGRPARTARSISRAERPPRPPLPVRGR